jgi:hypothetical protein
MDVPITRRRTVRGGTSEKIDKDQTPYFGMHKNKYATSESKKYSLPNIFEYSYDSYCQI